MLSPGLLHTRQAVSIPTCYTKAQPTPFQETPESQPGVPSSCSPPCPSHSIFRHRHSPAPLSPSEPSAQKDALLHMWQWQQWLELHDEISTLWHGWTGLLILREKQSKKKQTKRKFLLPGFCLIFFVWVIWGRQRINKMNSLHLKANEDVLVGQFFNET